ncbi:hypothetical protein HZA45_03625 [Candidatus Peregrinibacteria bacterium]|nr:hypothetical protein [Candidatus Peregrinibacteria bacterium]
MQQTCKQCSGGFSVTDEDIAFLAKLAPVIGGSVRTLPPPQLCPDCRQQRRCAFRNDQNYYRNTCCLCKKSLISIYSPDKKIQVLCDDCFWSDRFDPLLYGIEFDESRPFFEQFAELKAGVPRLAIYHTQSENAEYTVHSSRNRNCYMASSLVDCEEVYFSDFTFKSRDCMDVFSCEDMELCYECAHSEKCFGSDFLELCFNTSGSAYCFDCKGCTDCIGCCAQRNKTNWILNKAASKEEYASTLAKLRTDPAFRDEFIRKFEDLKLCTPKPAAWLVGCENSTGNYLMFSKNVRHGFNMKHCEDCMHVFEGHRDTDCCDIMRIGMGEMLYECAAIVESRFSVFCNLTYQCDNMICCDNCQTCSSCFGCMSGKKNRYCILNKQYTKEEYEKLVPTIIEQMRATSEWGEFFPATLSPFGYNETKAQEWFPLEPEKALARGWKWSDYEQPLPKGIKTIPASQLPPSVADVPDDVLEWAILCEATGKPFRIIPQELAFYRKRGLPLPHRSPQKRHRDRIAKQNPPRLYDRTCAKCTKEIQTTYAPDRPEIVYCETCYLQSIY